MCLSKRRRIVCHKRAVAAFTVHLWVWLNWFGPKRLYNWFFGEFFKRLVHFQSWSLTYFKQYRSSVRWIRPSPQSTAVSQQWPVLSLKIVTWAGGCCPLLSQCLGEPLRSNSSWICPVRLLWQPLCGCVSCFRVNSPVINIFYARSFSNEKFMFLRTALYCRIASKVSIDRIKFLLSIQSNSIIGMVMCVETQ